jgi:phenylacetate-CoA ligase
MNLRTLFYYKDFRKKYKFLKKSQWWTKQQLEKYQIQELYKLLNHAYKHVPYYTKMFDKIGLKPKDIQSLSNLQKLPFLTKNIIKENHEDLKATNYPKTSFELFRTGGSTGQPLTFYIEKGLTLSKQMAFAKLWMDWTGRSYFDRCVFITGEDVPFKYQLFGRTLVLSSFFMNDKYMPIFVDKIRKLKPKHILSYPSAITNLGIYMKKNNLEFFPSVNIIVCLAETLYDWQRDLLENFFQCRVHNQYGLREPVGLGGSCEYNNYYHMFPEYGLVELIGKEGLPVLKDGEIGEIVCTGFITHIFPFIRYRTGDLGVYTNKKCKCGRNYLLLERIQGRLQEHLVSKTNQLVNIIGLYGLMVKSSLNVKECQLYQDNKGEVIINIVKGENYSEIDTKTILKNFQKKLGDDFSLSVHFVDQIILSPQGKYKFLIQKLPINLTK